MPIVGESQGYVKIVKSQAIDDVVQNPVVA